MSARPSKERLKEFRNADGSDSANGCANCRFSSTLRADDTRRCLRFPPTVVVVTVTSEESGYDMRTVSPEIVDGDWCGEYEHI